MGGIKREREREGAEREGWMDRGKNEDWGIRRIGRPAVKYEGGRKRRKEVEGKGEVRRVGANEKISKKRVY